MEKFYRIKIEKKKVGDQEHLEYPKILGDKFVALAYNQDYSEAVIKVDVARKQHDAMAKGKNVLKALANTKEAGEVQQAYQTERQAATRVDFGGSQANPLAMSPRRFARLLNHTLSQENFVFPQEDWRAPEKLFNGWVNYGRGYNPAGFYKDSLGIVHFRGLIKGGTFAIQSGKRTDDKNGLIFELPEGYRPAFRQLHATTTYPEAAARLDISSGGKVVAAKGDKAWLSLDGITFRAARL